jgi:hypothetical protein
MIPMLSHGFTWWGTVLQGMAILHFIRRRPDTFWFYIIIFAGWPGALVYIAVELIPDLGLLRGTLQAFPRRKRIRELQALIFDNPSAGNYEELAGLFQDQKQYTQARECYNKAITVRTDSPDPFYRRAQCAIELKDFAAAVPDLERVFHRDRKYDFQRAAALLAHVYGNTGQPEQADALFREVLVTSTLSEAYINYSAFLAAQGRTVEARKVAQSVLAKKPAMPAYQKRRERPWFRKATQILKRLPA